MRSEYAFKDENGDEMGYSPVIRMSMNNFWSSKRGTSLIEILVVMFVLLVGIMTVIQLFPTGFGVVRDAESRTIATKLAQQELERWKNLSANIPTGILAINELGNPINNNNPGPPFMSFVMNGSTLERGNVLNNRQIFGETTSIPVASYFTTGGGTEYGSRYTLAFSPIETAWDEDNGVYTGIAVKSGDLRRRRGDKEQYPPYLRPGEYAVDYEIGNGSVFYIAVSKDSSDRLYYVSFSFWVTDDNNASGPPQLHSAINQPVTVPANNGEWQEVPIPVPPGFTLDEIDDNSDSCARGFVPQPYDTWGDSPYEFYVADQVLGIIAFNPKGHGTYEYTARGVRPIEARIDYRIYDARIIREDKIIPPPAGNATEIPIKLALRFILNAGDPAVFDDGDPTDNPDEPTFEGLMKTTIGIKAGASNPLIVSTSMLIIDLATGLRVDPTAITNIDYKAGIVTLPTTANLVDWNGDEKVNSADLVGKHLRFFYRADGDWSVQCQKAYAIYSRDWGGGALDYYHYRIKPGSGADGLSNELLFAPCEREKSVSVSYTYATNDGGVVTEHRVVGESHKISEKTTIITDPVTNADVEFTYINLDIPDDGYIPRNVNISVVGTSFRARVIWRDGVHWRHVDMDTTLLRK